jgi:hypothetical protein
MFVTLLGIEMEVKPLQYSKARPPMIVTPSGMLMDVRLEQFLYLQVVLYQLLVC